VRVVVRTGSMIPSMPKEKAKPQRSKGRIETLPSGSLRVTLYAGTDPITKNRMYLRETVPAGPNAEAEAKRILAGFVHEVYERRHPRTDATVRQLIERHLTDAKLGIKTRINYRSQTERHIIPCIGHQKVPQSMPTSQTRSTLSCGGAATTAMASRESTTERTGRTSATSDASRTSASRSKSRASCTFTKS
jgi:hypothetical protein